MSACEWTGHVISQDCSPQAPGWGTLLRKWSDTLPSVGEGGQLRDSHARGHLWDPKDEATGLRPTHSQCPRFHQSTEGGSTHGICVSNFGRNFLISGGLCLQTHSFACVPYEQSSEMRRSFWTVAFPPFSQLLFLLALPYCQKDAWRRSSWYSLWFQHDSVTLGSLRGFQRLSGPTRRRAGAMLFSAWQPVTLSRGGGDRIYSASDLTERP